MGTVVGGKRGAITDMNVVPLIDILLVLLVIFMVIPHSRGLNAEIPQPSADPRVPDKPSVVVIQVLADGSLRLNQQPVQWEDLENRLTGVFRVRADRTAFVQGDASVEFAVVARLIDAMHTVGIAPVGLLTRELGNGL
jgi:biopolymer transport protein TolR